MTLKAYTKGEHVLRFEAVVHNTRALHCGRVLDNLPTIIGKLAAMVDRFTTTLDCVDHTFIADDLLDRLPTPTQLGATRVGGIDLNRPRIRAALAAVLALSVMSGGFTVAEFTTKVHAMTGNVGYTIRQAAYDLRKLRGKQLIAKQFMVSALAPAQGGACGSGSCQRVCGCTGSTHVLPGISWSGCPGAPTPSCAPGTRWTTPTPEAGGSSPCCPTSGADRWFHGWAQHPRHVLRIWTEQHPAIAPRPVLIDGAPTWAFGVDGHDGRGGPESPPGYSILFVPTPPP